jgi:hypothetical protein
MILPTKTLAPPRSLIGIGAVILRVLNEPKAVSRTWQEFRDIHEAVPGAPTVTFAYFVLALDVLFMIGAIEMKHRRLGRVPQ